MPTNNLNVQIFDFHKQSYYFQLDWKEKINSRLSIPTALLSLFAGGIAYLIEKVPPLVVDRFGIIFIAFIVGAICCFCYASYHLFRCFIKYEYRYLATDSAIDDYIKLVKEYNNNPKTILKIDEAEEFYEFLTQQFVESATYNFNLNKRKSFHFVRVIQFSLATSIFLLLSAIPTFWKLKTLTQTPQQKSFPFQYQKDTLMLTHPMKSDKPDSSSQPKPSSGDSTQPSSSNDPQRPVRPPLSVVNESENPKHVHTKTHAPQFKH